MPTYQYACTACGEQHEAVQSFTDAPLTECPACGGRLRKVFSAVGVVFKGSGFYKNDSRSGSGGGKGKDAAASSSGDKADSSTKDAPAAKKDAPAASSSGTGSSSGGSSSSGSSSSSSSTPAA